MVAGVQFPSRPVQLPKPVRCKTLGAGSFPESWLRNLKLVELDLSQNQLRGKLPRLTRPNPFLDRISLIRNKFSGEPQVCSVLLRLLHPPAGQLLLYGCGALLACHSSTVHGDDLMCHKGHLPPKYKIGNFLLLQGLFRRAGPSSRMSVLLRCLTIVSSVGQSRRLGQPLAPSLSSYICEPGVVWCWLGVG